MLVFSELIEEHLNCKIQKFRFMLHVMETPELKKWAKIHPPIISIVASFGIMSIEAILKFLQLSKKDLLVFEPDQIPNAKKWLRLYRNPKYVRSVVIKCLKKFEGLSEFLGLSWEYVLKNPDSFKITKEDIESLNDEILSDVFNLMREVVLELQYEFFAELDPSPEEPVEDELEHLFSLPEIQFVYLVVLPSYLYYGESPTKIFRKAQKGDISSIDKILRIDPSTLGDPRIFDHFHFASKQHNRSDFNSMIVALKKPPKGKVTIQKIKYRLAGMIAALADKISYKLTVPEIEALFHCLAADFDKPELELIETEDIYNDSIRKQINREKLFWLKYMKLDKK